MVTTWSSGSPGLVVMGRDSCSEGRGFESRHHILDGHFSHLFVVKIVLLVRERNSKQMKKRPGKAHSLKQRAKKIPEWAKCSAIC